MSQALTRSANLLGITCSMFRSQPGVEAAVRANPEKIPLLIEEVLRYDSPVQMLFRHTMCDTELAGTTIPEGALVLSLLGSANRDPRKFENSESFDLNRNPKEIISFGYGPHYCLGQYLSRLESKIAVTLLLQRFSELMPLDDDIVWTDTYFARGPKTLPVRFKVR